MSTRASDLMHAIIRFGNEREKIGNAWWMHQRPSEDEAYKIWDEIKALVFGYQFPKPKIPKQRLTAAIDAYVKAQFIANTDRSCVENQFRAEAAGDYVLKLIDALGLPDATET